jgi:prepilin-type N-terminal cleavage/methylation domain-containing protein/prepilin-type processing-associated H-X9-DG protein
LATEGSGRTSIVRPRVPSVAKIPRDDNGGIAHPRRAAFSLIELIVVIGVIAILMAFLLPALRVARESARTVQCASQLRQIGFAIQQYANANQGRTPAWAVRHEWPDDSQFGEFYMGEWTGPGWPILIERYLGQNPGGAIWNCPSWPEAERRVNYFFGARWMRYQEPMVRSIPISRIRNSTTFILAGECVAPQYYLPPFGNDPTTSDFEDIDKDDGAIKCLRFFGEDGGYNIHRQGLNVLFADNHVATHKKFDPQSLSYSPDGHKTWEELKRPGDQ